MEGYFPLLPFVFKRVPPSLRSRPILLGVFQCQKHVIGGGGREGKKVSTRPPRNSLWPIHTCPA